MMKPSEILSLLSFIKLHITSLAAFSISKCAIIKHTFSSKDVLQFDNSHSWIRAKELYYRLEHKEVNTSTVDPRTSKMGLDSQEKPEESDEKKFEDCTEETSSMGLESLTI